MHWSSNMTCSAKKALTHGNLSSALQITFHFMRKKHIFMYLSFTLKIALSNFLSWERGFSALWPYNCLLAINTALVFLEVLKLVILCIEALTWLALQKSSNTWNLSSALQITFLFMRRKTSFMYLSFTLKICIKQLSLTEKEAFSICGLAFAIALKHSH